MNRRGRPLQIQLPRPGRLGYQSGTPKPDTATKQRNGRSGKTFLTEDGPLSIEVPRDRDGSFEPLLFPSTSAASIGTGLFEFPTAGRFNVEQAYGATLFTTPDDNRCYTVGPFNDLAGPRSADKAEELSRLEAVIRANWERLAEAERGSIVRAFQRTETPCGLTLFSIATEFKINDSLQYLVQFVATDGPRFGSISAEGLGPADGPLSELEPLMLQVKLAKSGT